MTKSDIHVANVPAFLERSVVQTTPIKKDRDKDLQPHKRCTQGEVRAACGGVPPNIELDDFEKKTPLIQQRLQSNL